MQNSTRRKDNHHRDGEESWQKILKWCNYNQGEEFLSIIGNLSCYNLALEEAKENLGVDSIVAEVVQKIEDERLEKIMFHQGHEDTRIHPSTD
ncbi:uncharacterized protein FPRN_07350 [Fusarium proliferatum]|nr:uncharacterized protein FPRN_07350 [Fusarium proliferatum]